MAKFISGVEVKIQVKKKGKSDLIASLRESAEANPNVKKTMELGSDRVFMDADLSVSQQVIEKFVEKEGLMKSQFVVKKRKVRVD